MYAHQPDVGGGYIQPRVPPPPHWPEWSTPSGWMGYPLAGPDRGTPPPTSVVDKVKTLHMKDEAVSQSSTDGQFTFILLTPEYYTVFHFYMMQKVTEVLVPLKQT